MKTLTVILNNEELFDIEYDDNVNVNYIIDNLESYIVFTNLEVEVEYFDDERIVLKTLNED